MPASFHLPSGAWHDSGPPESPEHESLPPSPYPAQIIVAGLYLSFISPEPYQSACPHVSGEIVRTITSCSFSGLVKSAIIIIIMNTSACQLFGNLGRKISSSSGDDREGAFLFQRVSVLVQRFNAVLSHYSLPTPDCTD